MNKTDIEKILRDLGLNNTYKGTKFIVDAVEIVIKMNKSSFCITKDIYPEVAKRHKTKMSCVEHDIRTAINTIWTNNQDSLMDAFNFKIRPTNSIFIDALAFYVIKEGVKNIDSVEQEIFNYSTLLTDFNKSREEYAKRAQMERGLILDIDRFDKFTEALSTAVDAMNIIAALYKEKMTDTEIELLRSKIESDTEAGSDDEYLKRLLSIQEIITTIN